jgi:hypothetical protein
MSPFPLLLNEKLRSRPGMFIGEPSLTKLAAYFRGYDHALHDLRGEPAHPFFHNFREWVVRRLQVPDYLGWEGAILQQCHSEREAFDRFWQLFDEYSAQNGEEAVKDEPQINGQITTNIAAK